MHHKRIGLLIAVVLLVVSAAIIVGATAARGTAAETNEAPSWLETATARTLASFPEAVAKSATWSLTTVDAYHKALPDMGSASEKTAANAAYVVLIDGEFSETRSVGGDEAVVSGTQMILVFDPGTQDLSVVGILKTPADASALGTSATMSL